MHDGPESAAGVREGDVLAGKYRIEAVLGVGGMGVVVAAQHLQLDTTVAIKFLLPDMLTNEEAVARFAREARAAVRITSEHVARVLDVGTLENGAPYMVMEFLAGGDLGAWLKQRGPLPVEQATEFVLQVCVAVAEAHGLGIVHRDLKPSNLFCVRRPDGQLSIKVLDFGISKLIDLPGSRPGMSVTKTATLMGSPLYMSPEQMQSAKDADAQSDIWALGVILYELLAGRVPFAGETITEVALKVVTQAPIPLGTFRPDAPPALETVILTCLQKDRRQRYRNVAELALALAEFAPKRARVSVERIVGTIQAAGLSQSALEMPPTSESGVNASPETIPPLGRTAPAPASRRAVAGIAAMGALVIAVVTGLMLLRSAVMKRPVTPASEGSTVVATEPSGPTVEQAAPPSEPEHPAIETNSPRPLDAVVVPTPEVQTKPTRPASPAHSAPPSSGTAARGHNGAASPPNCDPSFSLDEQGRKHFKPECFLKTTPRGKP